MKPGWKTTEFWVTMLTLASVVLGMVGGKVDGQTGSIVAAVAAGFYATARGLAKKSNTGDVINVRDQVLQALAGSQVLRNQIGGTIDPVQPVWLPDGADAPG